MKPFFLLLSITLLVACVAPLPPASAPSATPAPQATTPPPVEVEKIQVQAGSNDPLAITELRVEPPQLTLQPLEVAKVRILARLANGQTVEVINHSKLNWQIAEPTQISLLNGTLKALMPGESEVLIRAGNQETRLKLTVLSPHNSGGSIQAQALPEFVLPQPLYRLAVGENVYLQASLKQPDGSESKDLIFSVDKPELFELDSTSGRLRRLKAGAATITVQARLNGDLLKTIALEDKVIESNSSGGGGGGGGGGVPLIVSAVNTSPTPSPIETVTPSPSAAPVATPTPTVATPTPSAVPASSPTPTPIPIPTPTPTPLPTPTPIPTPTASPLPSQIPQGIIYMQGWVLQNQVYSREIYSIHTDGSNFRNLTNHPAHDTYFDVSPDGTKIAFLSNRDGTDSVYLMNSDGSNVQKIGTSLNYGNKPMVFSPDGKKLLYYRRTDAGNPIGFTIHNLETGSEFTLGILGEKMRWSPDGNWIVYTAPKKANENDIWIISSQGGTPQNLTGSVTTISENNTIPIWSPDGSKITFVSDRAGGVEAMYIMNKDGSNQIRCSKGIVPMAWSPDAFIYFFDGKGISVFDRVNDSEKQIYASQTSTSIDLSPDSHFMVASRFDAQSKKNLYIYRISDKMLTTLRADGVNSYDSPVWR